MAAKDSSVIVHGNNSGIIIIGNNNTIHIDKEKLLSRESVTNTFKSYYQNNFKTISLLIEDEKKPIDDIYVNLAIIKEEKEEDIKDKSKLLARDKIINSYEEIYKPKEPIAIEKLIEKSSKYNSAKALIYGKAGIGKTTFCKYIAYRWAKGELYSEFENIIYIALREWKEDGLESIIKKIYFEEKYKDYVIEINQSKTLFLFDGYDELSDTSTLHNAIKTYNLQNYIITSRPYGYRQSDFDVNEVFETVGFTDENVTAYIDKFFTESSHKTNLQNFLKQNINIKHIAYIPLILEMICSLWREKTKSNQLFLSPMTMTELYSEVIEYIFFEYTETNNTSYIQERENEIFDYLGKIAFEGLKRQIIILDKAIIKEKKEFFVDYILKTGFLKSDRKRRNPLMNSYEFLHLTFQEYFTALYVSKLPREEISEIIQAYKNYPYMQVFFTFLGGLIENKEWFLSEIENEKKDEIGYYEIVSILTFLSEIKNIEDTYKNRINHKIVKWLDFIIESYQHIEYEIFFDKLGRVSQYLNNFTIKHLINILREVDTSLGIRIRIIKLLSPLPIKYTKELIETLEHNNRYVRKQIIQYLLLTTENLIDTLKDSNLNLGVRIEIVEVLALEGRSVDALLNTLLSFMEDKNLIFKDREGVVRILTLFVSSDDTVVDILLAALQDRKFSQATRIKILQSLASLGRSDDVVVDALLTAINDHNIGLRKEIAELLVSLSISDARVLDILFAVLIQSKKLISEARRVLVWALFSREANNEMMTNALLTVIKSKKRTAEATILEIADLLASEGSSDDVVLDALFEVYQYQHLNSETRGKLAQALVRLGRSDDAVVHTLFSHIQDKNIHSSERDKIVRTLVSLGRSDDTVANTLFSVIHDKNIYLGIREKVLSAVVSHVGIDDTMRDTLLVVVKDESFNIWIRREVVDTLISEKNCDDVVLDTLLAILQDESFNLSFREAVATSLAQMVRLDIHYDVADALLSVIENESFNLTDRRNAAKALASYGRSDDAVVNTLFSIMHDKNINPGDEAEIVRTLISLGRSDDIAVGTLCKILQTKNLSVAVRGKLGQELVLEGRSDDAIIDALLEIIQDKSLNAVVRGKLAQVLVLQERSYDASIDALLEIIQDKSLDTEVRGELAQVLVLQGRSYDATIDTLLEIIQGKSLDTVVRGELAQILVLHGRSDDAVVDALSSVIQHLHPDLSPAKKATITLCSLISQNHTILKNINIQKVFSDILLKNSSIKSFVYAFENDYVSLYGCIKYALSNTLPIYIKQNKLCVIYQNKEIVFHKNVNLEELERVKIELGLADILELS